MVARPEPLRPDDTLPGWFRRRAEQHPDATAVICDDSYITYQELDWWSDALAARLVSGGVRQGDLVGLAAARKTTTVVGVLAILKAGAAYLPLDPAYPDSRLRFLAADAGLSFLLTFEPGTPALGDFPGVTIDGGGLADPTVRRSAGVLGRVARRGLATAAGLQADHAINGPAQATDLAYVIYTSGSTGQPKGVGVTHGNVIRLFRATAAMYDFHQSDVWTLFHSFTFDFSVWEMWGALLHGASLVIVEHGVSRSPDAFAELVRDSGTTILSQTPSAFYQFAGEVLRQAIALPCLRWVILGGEVLEVGALRAWLSHFGDHGPALMNMYGITETTVHVTAHRVRADDLGRAGQSRIGAPLNDLRVELLDSQDKPAPAGTPGEIVVSGAGVATGYLGRPALTAERFVPDPAAYGQRRYRSGDYAWRDLADCLVFVGRSDSQVKIRGFRIELGEIEAALLAHPDVASAVVVTLPAASGGRFLVAWVVPATPEASLNTATVRAYLARCLPVHMLPRYVLLRESVPLTTNGKADRQRLDAEALTTIPAASGRQIPVGGSSPGAADSGGNLTSHGYDHSFKKGGEMPGTAETDDRTYLVVVNDEEQYSIWDAAKPVPAGWYPDGTKGSKQHCLDHISKVWTDMRPKSLRDRTAR